MTNLTIVVLGNGKKEAINQWLRWYKNISYSNYQITICESTSLKLDYNLSEINVPIKLLSEDIDKTILINKAITASLTKYVLLTHVNIKPDNNMIHHLLAALIVNKNICAVSPIITYMKSPFFTGTILKDFNFSYTKQSIFNHNVNSTDSITRHCVMLKKYDWKLIGGLDSNFGGVYDDLDWSNRAKLIGFDLAVNFNAKAVTFGIKKYSFLRREISKHLWIRKNTKKMNSFFNFIKTILLNNLYLPIDILSLHPMNFIYRYIALYRSYFKFKIN